MSAFLLAQLGVVCPSCERLNAPGAEGCEGCGSPLVEAAPTAARKSPLGDGPVATTAPYATPKALPAQPPAATARAAGAASSIHPESSVPPGVRTSRPAAAPAPAPAPKVTVEPRPPAAASTPRPQAHPAAPATPAASAPPSGAEQPIPASELVKRAPAAPAKSAGPTYTVTAVAGSAKGQRYRLPVAGVGVGRSKGALLFPDDHFVSPHHATLTVRNGQVFIRDDASVSGVYLSLSGQTTLGPGSLFCAGQRLFRFVGAVESPPAAPGRPIVHGAPVPAGQPLYAVEEVLQGSRSGRTVVSPGPLMTIGQSGCDLSFPGDQSLAARHCELEPAASTLKDLSGGLGTYVRLPAKVDRQIKPGDRVRIGQQVLQIDALG